MTAVRKKRVSHRRCNMRTMHGLVVVTVPVLHRPTTVASSPTNFPASIFFLICRPRSSTNASSTDPSTRKKIGEESNVQSPLVKRVVPVGIEAWFHMDARRVRCRVSKSLSHEAAVSALWSDSPMCDLSLSLEAGTDTIKLSIAAQGMTMICVSGAWTTALEAWRPEALAPPR